MMRNAASDGYFVPNKYQTPPEPRHSPRRHQRRLGPVVKQRLESLEERRGQAGADAKRHGPATVSKSATELGRRLPRVYAGIATVTDLTATSSSVETLLSRDDAANYGGGDLECLSLDTGDVAEGGGSTEDAVDESASMDDVSLDDPPFYDAGDDAGHANVAEDSSHLGGSHFGPNSKGYLEVRPGVGSLLSSSRESRDRGNFIARGEISRTWKQKWETRVDNNGSVLNLCRRISLLNQRKVYCDTSETEESLEWDFTDIQIKASPTNSLTESCVDEDLCEPSCRKSPRKTPVKTEEDQLRECFVAKTEYPGKTVEQTVENRSLGIKTEVEQLREYFESGSGGRGQKVENGDRYDAGPPFGTPPSSCTFSPRGISFSVPANSSFPPSGDAVFSTRANDGSGAFDTDGSGKTLSRKVFRRLIVGNPYGDGSGAFDTDGSGKTLSRKVFRRLIVGNQYGGLENENIRENQDGDDAHSRGQSDPDDGAAVIHAPAEREGSGTQREIRNEAISHSLRLEQEEELQQQKRQEPRRRRGREGPTDFAKTTQSPSSPPPRPPCHPCARSMSGEPEWVSASKFFLHGVIVGTVLTGAALLLLNRFYLIGATGFGCHEFQSPPPT